MRARIATSFVLLLGSATLGCGAVDDGLCPGEQSDEISCTVDVCSGEEAGWAHIPNNSLCEAGQACSPTAGCVAAGALTGTATLLGADDHSGITVTVAGLEGATATTDAAGAWSILVPAGTYSVTYTKEKYITEENSNIIVLAEAAERTPDVELAHGTLLGADRVAVNGYGSQLNPNKTFLIETIDSPFGNRYYATSMDAPKEPVLITTNPNSIQFTNNHAVWSEGNVVFARPLSGATEAVNLSSGITGGSISIAGVSNTYVTLRRVRQLPTYQESTVYVAKIDGSAPATNVWTQPDNLHVYAGYIGNDAFGLLAINNNSNQSGPPVDATATKPILRIDLATGVATAIEVGFATQIVELRGVSPDGTRVIGAVYQNTGNGGWYRGFTGNVSSGALTLAPNAGFTPGYTNFHDYPVSIDAWTPDNGVIYRNNYYYVGGPYLGGELRYWPGTGSPISIIPNNPPIGYQLFGLVQYQVLNGAVVWFDSGNARFLRVSSVGPTSTTYNLDTSGTVNTFWAKAGVGAGGNYIAWTVVPGGTSLPGKVFGANVPAAVNSQPPIVQLGPNVPATCSFEGILAGTTYFQLCSETGTLTSYAAASNTPAGTTTGVQGSLFAVGTGDRIGFRKTDGNVYTASSSGSFADVKAVATKIDGNSPVRSVGSWLLYRDGAELLTRVSKADGSAIDEPLFGCDLAGNGQVWLNETGTQLFGASARCRQLSYGLVHAPTANLP